MKFPPQPCISPSESARLGAKQGHATSAKSATYNSKKHLNFLTFLHSHVRTSSRPLRPLRKSSAFSLTEVVIAMGVAAVAFTSIIALFPLGLNMSKESYEATQAALIAQTILTDVRDQQTGKQNLRTADPFSFRLIQITNNSDPISISNNYALVPINDPATIQTVYIAYKPFAGTSDTDTNNPSILRPAAGQLNGTIPNWYTNGSNGCFALVKATFSPTLRYSTPTNNTATRLDISVETPGNANISNRTCFLFTSAFRP
jgi:type II secretory pathway pseudopilin PulG